MPYDRHGNHYECSFWCSVKQALIIAGIVLGGYALIVLFMWGMMHPSNGHP